MIYNPVSGTQDAEARLSLLRRLMEEAGLCRDPVETDRELGAEPAAKNAVGDGMERVIVWGGDGSVTEAAHVLAGTQVALGVVPGGTGNLLAVNLGIPTDAEQAMRLALTGEAHSIDVGRANGRTFLIAAGIGADARMIQDTGREAKRRLGPLAYFLAAWRHVRRPLTRYRITIDGTVLERRAQSVLVANLGRVTGGLELVPDTGPETGLLQVTIIRARTVWDMMAIGVRALLRRHRSDNLVELHGGRHILIETPRAQPAQIDGNELPATTRLELTVAPRALMLVHELPQGSVSS